MAEERLRALLDEVAKENKYSDYSVEITPISSGGANYTSKLFQATISVPNFDGLKLFAKVINISEEMRNVTGDKSIFETELYFYTVLNKVYEALQNKHRVQEEHKLIVPKFYKSNSKRSEEILLLEDLTVKGFSTYNRMTSITWEYAAAAVSQLAKFHALSFAYKHENPEEFAAVVERFPFILGAEEVGDIFLEKTLKVTQQVLKDEYKDRVTKFFSEKNRFMQLTEFSKMYKSNILTHVDYRQSNLMHRRKNGKLQVIPVDYQTMCAGSPVADLLYFIFSGSDGQFRKYHYANLIEYYYNELTASLRRLDIDIKDVYPKEDYTNELKLLEMYGLIMSVLILPIVCVNTEHAPNMGEDSSFDEMNLVPSEEYRRRINDVVADYIRWGLL